MKKTIMLLVAAVVLSSGAAYLAVKLTTPSAPAASHVTSNPTPAPDKDVGMIYPIGERVLNLTPSLGVPHYARIEFALAFQRPAGTKPPKPGSAGAKATVVPLEPGLDPVVAHKVQIDDAVVQVVGSRTLESLSSNDGRDAMKQELLRAVAQIVASPAAMGVYIVTLVVQ